MTDDCDPSLDALLILDGEAFIADPEGRYWVRFIVKQVPPSPDRPHGLSYSLTLHDKTGARLVGSTTCMPRPPRRVARGA